MQELAILTVPRTGSSYFCDCLAGVRGTIVAREIFNPRGYKALLALAPARRRFEELVGDGLSGRDDPRLHRYFKEHPLEAVSTLAEAASEAKAAILNYKIIDHQITSPALEALLSRRRPAVIVLVRQRLDVFISQAKASAIGTWHRENTQNVIVDVDLDRFMAWSRGADQFYNETLDLIARLGLPALVLDYDRHIDCEADELRERIVRWLSALHFWLPPGTPKGGRTRHRQDARTDPFSKIGNGPELRRQLMERGLLDYALNPPLANHIAPR